MALSSTSSRNSIPMILAVVAVAILMAASPSPASARRSPPQGSSNFTFYVHNQVYNPAVNNSVFTSMYSAGPFNFSQPNLFSFSVRSMFEMPITAGPSANSTQIGVAQGVWILDSQKGYVLLHMFTATITSGPYKGTIAIMGQIVEAAETRTLAVIGGTGNFLAAHGAAVNKLVTIDRVAPAKWSLSFELDLYY